MPVITQKEVSYVLANVSADMEQGHIVANLRRFLDGEDTGIIEVVVQGEDFAALLLAVPEPGQTRADDIAQMVYNHAVSKGRISGEIQ